MRIFNNYKNKTRLSYLNGGNIDCVLGNIGAIKIKNTDNYTFDVIKYIKSTMIYADKDKTVKPDILANIIGQEFIGLDYEIEYGLRTNIYTEEELKLIKQYLLDTYFITAERDVSRSSRRIIEKISNILNEEYTKLPHVNDNFGIGL